MPLRVGTAEVGVIFPFSRALIRGGCKVPPHGKCGFRVNAAATDVRHREAHGDDRLLRDGLPVEVDVTEHCPWPSVLRKICEEREEDLVLGAVDEGGAEEALEERAQHGDEVLVAVPPPRELLRHLARLQRRRSGQEEQALPVRRDIPHGLPLVLSGDPLEGHAHRVEPGGEHLQRLARGGRHSGLHRPAGLLDDVGEDRRARDQEAVRRRLPEPHVAQGQRAVAEEELRRKREELPVHREWQGPP
mmetsp:Transcript_106614/g.301651  ORF Transcript_106614/g.301651 Transcript_106614/m.301651 type:complete len:246 (-) Transcript_106614:36-773(-)